MIRQDDEDSWDAGDLSVYLLGFLFFFSLSHSPVFSQRFVLVCTFVFSQVADGFFVCGCRVSNKVCLLMVASVSVHI